MTTKTRLVEALSKDLVDKFNTDVYGQGNLKSELSSLLKDEFDNSLDERESLLLDAYKIAFDFNANYRVDTEWDLEFYQHSAQDSYECEDIEEARRLMSQEGDDELEEPDYSQVANNMDFGFGDLLEKSVSVQVDFIELKTNWYSIFHEKDRGVPLNTPQHF